MTENFTLLDNDNFLTLPSFVTFYLVWRLEHEGDVVRLVLGLDGDDVVVGGAAEDLGHGAQVHAHGQLTVAPTKGEIKCLKRIY